MRTPKLEEGSNEVSIREGPEELTLFSEEVGASVTMRRTGGDRPWLMLIGMPFAKQSIMELMAATGENCTSTTKK